MLPFPVFNVVEEKITFPAKRDMQIDNVISAINQDQENINALKRLFVMAVYAESLLALDLLDEGKNTETLMKMRKNLK